MAAERSGSPAVRLLLAYTFRLFKNLSLMVVEWCGVGVLCEGPVMDTRRSFYLAPGQDDFAESAPDACRVNYNDIPYITAAIGLHSGSRPN
jgi:hypothetical protein